MAIVGLADKAVAESRECVRAALSSLCLALPAKRIAVNLPPADIGKEGAHFDLLPPLSACEAFEVTVIHSIIGKVPKGGLSQKCPFREPHHFASMAALVRGGQKAMPGEILPAHTRFSIRFELDYRGWAAGRTLIYSISCHPFFIFCSIN